jgi:choline dehydrogenase-like flavoprotein
LLTAPERRLVLLLRVLTFVFALTAPLFLLAAIAIPDQADWAQVGFAVNSVTKVGVLAGIAAIAAADVRRFSVLVVLLIVAHAISVVAIVVVLVAADTSATFAILGFEPTLTALLIGVLVMDGAIGVLLVVFLLPARRARYGLASLPPMAFEALAALAEVTVRRGERLVTPEEVARNVDGYMTLFTSKRKRIVPLALVLLWLYPLLHLRAPFPLLSPDDRASLVEARLLRPASSRFNWFRRLVRAMIRLTQQLVFMGYYGDHRTFSSVGYTPFRNRERAPDAIRDKARPVSHLRSTRPDEVGDSIDADAVVLGSGAGGAIAAYRLAEAGRKVLVLEAGRHVDPADFSDDEVRQIAVLYADGALQQSTDFAFRVLQGKCVGGSTTVNNAVCFDLPDHVRNAWNARYEAGIDPDRLQAAFASTRKLIGVTRPPSEHLEGGWQTFEAGVEALGLIDAGYKLGVVDANIADCPGSGYCNIGCPYGNKLSTLHTLLPQAQRKFSKENLRVLPECTAVEIEHEARRAQTVVARLGNRTIRVRARTVVVSCGTIASSWLLMRSGIARSRAGRRLAFNVGSPMTAEFDHVLDSFDGVQISHVLQPPPSAGFVVETWFNPVVSQALNMPGWFDDHWRNMACFRHLTAAGVLVGTTTESARIKRSLTRWVFGDGPDLDYTPGRGDARNLEDFRRVIDGLKLVGEIFLAAGAKRVMPSTFLPVDITDAKDLDHLGDRIRDPSDLSIGTGHPQGGNAMSLDPARGVVDPDCRVHGFENLFVCDASVFPAATTVNPQLTVMAIAEMVAPRVVAAT